MVTREALGGGMEVRGCVRAGVRDVRTGGVKRELYGARGGVEGWKAEWEGDIEEGGVEISDEGDKN